MKIAIVGAGITGLTAAYRLSQKGHRVTVFEKEGFVGGLSAGFKKEGWNWSLENYFHHLFTSDLQAQNLVFELGLKDKLFYKRPRTSILCQGQISQFDSPLTILRSPLLSLPDKLRTGLTTLYLKLDNNWKSFEKHSAFEWLEKYYGKRVFNILWKPLLLGKFAKEADKISMAWFWARIKKRSIKLGYLEGGFQTLIDELARRIKSNGGLINLNHQITDLGSLKKDFQKIILTCSYQTFFKDERIPNMLGAVNLILILKEKFLVDDTYWLNVNDPGFPFVAVVEHTNFIEPKHYNNNYLLYVGGYYTQNHPYFKMTKKQILAEFLPYLTKINQKFTQSSILDYQVSTNLFAQPQIPLNYSRIIPPHQTDIPNVFLANMQQIYPWDRGTNYAVETGERIAKLVLSNK